MNDERIVDAFKKYTFYHNIRLTDKIVTPGNPGIIPTQNLILRHLRALDCRDKRVLDIGCRDGYFAFEAESMGATEVIGIDNDISNAAVEFLIPFLKSKVKMYEMNLYDLRPETFGLFDIVIFPGVLYHLRYPFWGLKAVRDLLNVGGQLLIETAIWEREPSNSLLFCPTFKDSPYEGTSCAFFNRKGLIDTLSSMGLKVTSTEFLPRNAMGRVKDGIKRSLIYLKTMKGSLPPIRDVNRCVFTAEFLGIDNESHLMQYWEHCHNLHSEKCNNEQEYNALSNILNNPEQHILHKNKQEGES